MFFDLTMTITSEMLKESRENPSLAKLTGHVGTHFDTMDKEFPLNYFRLPGYLADVRAVKDREIGLSDVALDEIPSDSCVLFYSGFSEEEEYGSAVYWKAHPELSQALIDALLDRGVRIIAVDFAGVRRGKEHTPADQRCADRHSFVVENLIGLGPLAEKHPSSFSVYTFPLKLTGMTGIPCRIAAEC